MDLTNAEIGALSTGKTFESLPLNGRSWSSLANLRRAVYQNHTHPNIPSPDRTVRGFGMRTLGLASTDPFAYPDLPTIPGCYSLVDQGNINNYAIFNVSRSPAWSAISIRIIFAVALHGAIF